MSGLSGTQVTLAASLSLAAGAIDPLSLAAWGAIGNAFILWATTPGNIVPTPSPAPSPLTAAGTAITGNGLIVTTNASGLGSALATAAKATAAQPVAAWQAIAGAFATWLGTSGQIDPGLLVAVPAGGAVTGTGKLKFSSLLIGPSIAAAAGAVHPIPIAAWTAIGAALLNHFVTNAVILPGLMVSPSGGGAVTGLGVFS